MRRLLFIGLLVGMVTLAFGIDDVYYWRGANTTTSTQAVKQTSSTRQTSSTTPERVTINNSPRQDNQTRQTQQDEKVKIMPNHEQRPDTVRMVIRR